MRRFLPLLLLLPGCIGPNDSAVLGGGDSSTFFEQVEPVLTEGCANPSCHGNTERPFQVYAVHRHRLLEEDTWSDSALSADEHAANLETARAFAPSPWLLSRKPLDPAVGGMVHAGGVMWSDVENPDYTAVRAWSVAR